MGMNVRMMAAVRMIYLHKGVKAVFRIGISGRNVKYLVGRGYRDSWPTKIIAISYVIGIHGCIRAPTLRSWTRCFLLEWGRNWH